MLTTAFEHALSWPHFTDEEAETRRGKGACLQEGIKLSKEAGGDRDSASGSWGSTTSEDSLLEKDVLFPHATDQHRTCLCPLPSPP